MCGATVCSIGCPASVASVENVKRAKNVACCCDDNLYRTASIRVYPCPSVAKNMSTITTNNELDRYHRQMLLPGFGEEGQRRLMNAKVFVCGCGALGTVIANMLARAGVGHLVIADRDFIEITNLQRQILFDEA